MDIAGTGADVDQTWIDTIGSNVANMNDAVTPGQPVYQAQYVDAGEQVEPADSGTPGAGVGVQVDAVTLGPGARARSSTTPPTRSPNAQGEVEYPVVDLGHGDDRSGAGADLLSGERRGHVAGHDAYQAILDIKA